MEKNIRKLCLPVLMLGALAGKAQTTWHFGTHAKLKFTAGGSPTALAGCSIHFHRNGRDLRQP